MVSEELDISIEKPKGIAKTLNLDSKKSEIDGYDL